VFVQAEYSTLDASKRAFFYQAQRDHATRAYLVPFPEFLSLATDLSKGGIALDRVLFLQSTGRCGSTLLSKVVGNLAGIYSISEADVYTLVASILAIHPDKLSKSKAVEVLRALTVFLVASIKKARPETDVIAIKHRSFVTLIADLCRQAVPEAKVSPFSSSHRIDQ
jgi:hypothetical protein